jgi:hypothetical protein
MSDPSSNPNGGGDVASPVQCCPAMPDQPPLRIRASLFFDGTKNNRTNVELGRSFNSDESYTNGLSNIAKLESAGLDQDGPDVDWHFTVYTEGMGTTNRESDSTLGFAFGTGKTGIPARVESGIASAISSIRSFACNTSHIKHIHIDTFGFSRGAAAARHCIWECMQEARTTLKERLKAVGITVDEVVVKFVGLYDTVASYGLNHSNDTEQLHLNAISIAEKVVQLAAAEEHRANFRLTNINSAGGKGKEFFLPGVHSDVGGGYADGDSEQDMKVFDLSPFWHSAAKRAAIERERNWLVASGWYRADELSAPHWNEIRVTRAGIPNTYSHIPLQMMARFARQNGVHIHERLESKHPIPAALSTVDSKLRAYVDGASHSTFEDWFKADPALEPEWHKTLRHDYLHFSARYGTTMGAYKPQWSDEGEVHGRRMRIIQNG